METNSKKWKYGYDAGSRMNSWTDPNEKITKVKYDANHNRKSLIIEGKSIDYKVKAK